MREKHHGAWGDRSYSILGRKRLEEGGRVCMRNHVVRGESSDPSLTCVSNESSSRAN